MAHRLRKHSPGYRHGSFSRSLADCPAQEHTRTPRNTNARGHLYLAFERGSISASFFERHRVRNSRAGLLIFERKSTRPTRSFAGPVAGSFLQSSESSLGPA